MKSIQVRVQLFGAFRKYSSGSDLRFEVPPGTTVSAVRGHLGAGGGRGVPAFVGRSPPSLLVLADADRVLDEDQLLGAGLDVVTLAVLPPVCGG
jgi:molybdopterin converting factor small subunit